MADSITYQACIWEDFEGFFTGRILSIPKANVVGRKPADIVLQLKDYLAQLNTTHLPHRVRNLKDAKADIIKIEIQPSISIENQTFMARETIHLAFPCIYGHDYGQLLVCILPTLDINFTFYEESSRKSLAQHFVRDKLQGCSITQLMSYLPVKNFYLEEIKVNRKRRKKPQDSIWKFLFSEQTMEISQVCDPLTPITIKSKALHAWARNSEIEDLIQRLNTENANVILLGEAGVGKTTILYAAIRKILRNKVARGQLNLQDAFWQTNDARIISGMKYLGDWQKRCERLVSECNDGYLCFEHLTGLLKAGGQEAGNSLAAFFMYFLQRGDLHMIVKATPGELTAARRLLPGFIDCFQIVNIQPLDRARAYCALSEEATDLSKNKGMKIESGALMLILSLFKRFMPYYMLPGHAIDFLRQSFKEEENLQHKEVTNECLISRFIKKTGLPESLLKTELILPYEQVLQSFEEKIIGQPDACRNAATMVTTFKSGMNDPDRPLGVFLFCGPTGVGKTALARTLADYIFKESRDDRLIRLDMSEYNGPDAVDRLLSFSQKEPGILAKRLRAQPFSIVLLDEIEKASPEVFDVFLNIFDEGRLMDQYGQIVTFRSAIIIMTSNIGASQRASLGFTKQSISYLDEVMSFFRLEFFNRIDAVVSFNPLSESVVRQITEKELQEIEQREGMKAANLSLTWTDAALNHLAQCGFDKRYGARPLQRTLERLVVVPISRLLVDNPGLRNTTIHLDMENQPHEPRTAAKIKISTIPHMKRQPGRNHQNH